MGRGRGMGGFGMGVRCGGGVHSVVEVQREAGNNVGGVCMPLFFTWNMSFSGTIDSGGVAYKLDTVGLVKTDLGERLSAAKGDMS